MTLCRLLIFAFTCKTVFAFTDPIRLFGICGNIGRSATCALPYRHIGRTHRVSCCAVPSTTSDAPDPAREIVHFNQETEQSNWVRCQKDLNIILVGNPMVGKSTLANIVSRKLNMTMVDVDDHVHVIGRYAPDDAHARVLECILNREHYTTRESVGGIVVACGGYMINRIDVVNVLLRAKREGHLIFHLQRKRFWQSAATGKYKYSWPFVDLTHVPFSQSRKAPTILSAKYFTEARLKQLTEKIYATRPGERELKSGTFTPYSPRKTTSEKAASTQSLPNNVQFVKSTLVTKSPMAMTGPSTILPGAFCPINLTNRVPVAAGTSRSSEVAATTLAAAPAAQTETATTDAAPAAAAGGPQGEAANNSDPGTKTRAWLAEQMESSVFSEQIEALYRKARSHQFYAIYDETRSMKGNAELAARDFYMLVYRLARLDQHPVTLGGLVVSLTAKSVTELLVPGGRGRDRLSEMLVGAEAVELRVDMLAAVSYASREYVKAQYGLLRRHCRLPVVWTVRSQRQGGEFKGGEDEYVLLCKLGAELGAEFVEVETCWSPAAQLNIMRSRRQAVIISTQVETREAQFGAGYLAAELGKMAAACEGRAGVLKLVVESSADGQVEEMEAALAAHARRPGAPPAVGLCVGKHYAQSVVENPVMSYCSLYSPRGLPPTTADVLRARAAQGVLQRRRLAVVAADAAAAAPTAASLGAAMADVGMDGVYATDPVGVGGAGAAGGDAWAGEVRGLLQRPETAGVVLAERRWRRAGMKLADSLTPAAIFIGEVTLLQPRMRAAAAAAAAADAAPEEVSVMGDNTEWVAIRAALARAVARHGVQQPAMVAVVGSLGRMRACLFALESLPDAKVAKPVALHFVHDPQPAAGTQDADAAAAAAAAADELAQDFASCRAAVGGAEPAAADVVVSLLPAGDPAGAFPDALLRSAPGGRPVLVLEAAQERPDAATAPGGVAGAGLLASRCAAAGATHVAAEELMGEWGGALAELLSHTPAPTLRVDPPQDPAVAAAAAAAARRPATAS